MKSRQWGFTHDRLRKAWQLIRRVSRNDTLFTWITYGNPRTTSPLEGGINAPIRDLLRRHRGMSEHHRRRAIEWFLVLHELPLERALTIAHTATPHEPAAETEEPDGPTLHDTGLDAREGLWLRTGWAGRG